MVSRQYGQAPRVLPGPSAGARFMRSLRFLAALSLAIPAAVFQSYVPYQSAWVTFSVSYFVVTLALWVASLVRAVKRQNAEMARGYTTVLYQANVHAELFLLDLDTLEVLSDPGETRPEDTRRKTLEAWRAARRV